MCFVMQGKAPPDAKVFKAAAAAVDRAQMRASLDSSAARAFFTNLALRLDLKADASIETADVDGKTIRYNPEFIASLTPDEVHFVIVGHETAHCHLLHTVRGMGMDCLECRQIAADLEDNFLCRSAGFASLAGCVYAGEGQFKDCPVGDTFEQHYARLHAKHKPGGGNKGPRIFKPGTGQDGKPYKPQPGDIFLPGDYTPAKDEAQAQQIEAEWRGKIAAAAQDVGRRMAAGKLKGDLPGVLQDWITAVLHPKPHWRERLRLFMQQSLRHTQDNDWSRRSRRGLAADIYLPRKRGEELGEIVIAIDTSGSVGDDLLLEFGKELQGVIDCEPCKAHIIYCDAAVQHVDTWEPSDGPLVFRSVGRGGTDFRPIWRYIRDNEIEPACCIYLTDGYGDYGQEPPYPVLWALSEDYDVPWGKKVLVTP